MYPLAWRGSKTLATLRAPGRTNEAYQDTVELSGNERYAWLRGGLRKSLVLDFKGAQTHGVPAVEAGEGATAVLDGKLGSIGLQCRVQLSTNLIIFGQLFRYGW